jgi:hypothetical protein
MDSITICNDCRREREEYSENKNYFIITQKEFFAASNEVFADQIILRILQKKGAPIGGTFYLEVKPGYKVIRNKDHKKNSLCYQFIKETE